MVNCSYEIKRCLLLGRKAKTNLDSVLKSIALTLPTNDQIAKAVVFPVVTYGCEGWTIKTAEHRRTDAFKLCWRRFLRVPWTTRRSNQSILKEINTEYSLEGLMLKPKLQYLATWCEEPTHWKWLWCWERLRVGGEGTGWDGWIASPTQWTGVSKLGEIVKDREEWRNCTSWGRKESHRSLRLNYNKVMLSERETGSLQGGTPAPRGGTLPLRAGRRRGVGRLGPREIVGAEPGLPRRRSIDHARCHPAVVLGVSPASSSFPPRRQRRRIIQPWWVRKNRKPSAYCGAQGLGWRARGETWEPICQPDLWDALRSGLVPPQSSLHLRPGPREVCAGSRGLRLSVCGMTVGAQPRSRTGRGRVCWGLGCPARGG